MYSRYNHSICVTVTPVHHYTRCERLKSDIYFNLTRPDTIYKSLERKEEIRDQTGRACKHARSRGILSLRSALRPV